MFIDTSLLDVDLFLMAPRIASFLAGEPEPRPSGATDSVLSIYQTFETADRPIAVAVGNDPMWKRFCGVLGLDDLANDPDLASNAGRRIRGEALVEMIQERLRTRSASTWLAALAEVSVPSSEVKYLSDVVSDPQVEARRSIRWIDHAEAGRVGVVGRPWRTDADQSVDPGPPPELGVHAREVLAEAGYEPEEIERLIERQAVWLPES